MYALVFPGQGIQRRGMGGGLFEEFPELTATADEILGYSVADLCSNNGDNRLSDTRFAQPAIFVVNALAAHRLAIEHPGRYSYFAGHSLGEYNALVAAGVLSFEAGLGLVRQRAALMSKVTGGGMAAVSGMPVTQVENTLRVVGQPHVFIANRNSDSQTTIAGDRMQLQLAARAIKNAGAANVAMLNVSGPFHTPLMAGAEKSFAATLRACRFAVGHTPVVSSVTGSVFDPARAARVLSRQIASPVDWVGTVRALRGGGVTRFEEVNGAILTKLIDGIR